MERELLKHSETNNSTFGFNLLNDKQRFSISERFDFLHCSINEDAKSGRVMLRSGHTFDFTLSLTGVKNIK